MFNEEETKRIVDTVNQAATRLTKTTFDCSMMILNAKLELIRSHRDYYLQMKSLMDEGAKMVELLSEWLEHHTDPGFDDQFAQKIVALKKECETVALKGD